MTAQILSLPAPDDEPLQLPPGMLDINGDVEVVKAFPIDEPDVDEKPTPKKGGGAVPHNFTELYTMAADDLGVGTEDAREIMQQWLETHHSTTNIGAYVKNGGRDALATLWELLKQSI